jgi:hypothetical protein
LLDIPGPGESAAAAEGSLEQQNYHHFYNQYYGHHNPNQHHQAGMIIQIKALIIDKERRRCSIKTFLILS